MSYWCFRMINMCFLLVPVALSSFVFYFFSSGVEIPECRIFRLFSALTMHPFSMRSVETAGHIFCWLSGAKGRSWGNAGEYHHMGLWVFLKDFFFLTSVWFRTILIFFFKDCKYKSEGQKPNRWVKCTLPCIVISIVNAFASIKVTISNDTCSSRKRKFILGKHNSDARLSLFCGVILGSSDDSLTQSLLFWMFAI